ncbi:MAG: recombination protein RecR [Alphaproteobacteria bacterium]|jgi:recombination protein RecR|nr:recombination protein RecR [Alphaproteobacteria bacterium]
MSVDNPLDDLIRRLARLPGLGTRSARRAVLHLMKNRDSLMLPLAEDISRVAQSVRHCVECGNFDTADTCRICRNTDRDQSRICVVEDVADLWAMERAGVFSGRYHVLGGVMSAIDGVGPEELRIDYLVSKSGEDAVQEVILATSATVDGQTTAHYIAERLEPTKVQVTRLAHGVPVGGELDYLDDGTLAQAMRARRQIND